MKKVKILIMAVMLMTGCSKKGEHENHTAVKFTCSMHPQIISDKPGTCPICAMDLVQLDSSGNAGEIRLDESQVRLANITTTLVRTEEIGRETIVNGKLAVNESEVQIVAARVAGRIDKLTIKETGQPVVQGQALYQIYSEELLTLEQEFLLAKKQADELKKPQYAHFAAAAEKKLLLFGLTKEQVAKLASFNRADPYVTFMSPASGIVTRIEVTEGQYLQDGDSMYRIEKQEKLWVDVQLFPGESSSAKKGDKVSVKVSGFEGYVSGVVTFISPEYSANRQVINLRAEIPNREMKFLPGMQASIRLTHGSKKAIVLPLDAVVRAQSGSHVWILTPDGAYVPRMVETGIETSEKIEITSGVSEKENAVITGAYLLYGELILKRGGNLMASH